MKRIEIMLFGLAFVIIGSNFATREEMIILGFVVVFIGLFIMAMGFGSKNDKDKS